MSTLITLGLIGLVGFLCQWLSSWVRLPAILFLLLAGILLGPVFSLVDPDALFGDLLFPYISLSVAVILFEGALTLKQRELAGIGRPVRNMVTYGVLITAAIMALAAHYLVELSWPVSALFGAIMVVTGPTVIIPMLKTVRPVSKVGDVLRWEGIVIDPIGALFAVLVFEWIVVQHSTTGTSEIFIVFAGSVFTGLAIGLGAGYAFGQLLRHHLIPESILNFASLSIVCFVFALSDTLMHESGLLAVTVMGILLANMKDVHIHSILDFKEDLTIVFVSALFIVLAARVDFSGFVDLGWSAVLLFFVMQFIARPAKVALSFIGSDFSWQERAMVSWIGPRGIVAAAISAVFALRLEELGVASADKLVPLAFLIIIGTVVFQSFTSRLVAGLLKVAQPATHGVLIIGSNPLAIQIAEAMKRAEVETVLCDTSWDNLRAARIAGLRTYYGNPSSDHAGLHLSLEPYGYMLGLSNHHEYNITQAAHFRSEFGARNVFVLPPNQSVERLHKHMTSTDNSGRILFDMDSHYLELKQRINKGAVVKSTELREAYDYEQWQADNPEARVLFAIQPNNDISFDTLDKAIQVPVGSKLFSLSYPETNGKAEADADKEQEEGSKTESDAAGDTQTGSVPKSEAEPEPESEPETEPKPETG